MMSLLNLANTTRRAAQSGALALALLGLSACPTDDTSETGDSDSDSQETTGDELACDPVGDNPEVGELLNAPVADDVEVIVKTPQHPGEAGPDNLP